MCPTPSFSSSQSQCGSCRRVIGSCSLPFLLFSWLLTTIILQPNTDCEQKQTTADIKETSSQCRLRVSGLGVPRRRRVTLKCLSLPNMQSASRCNKEVINVVCLTPSFHSQPYLFLVPSKLVLLLITELRFIANTAKERDLANVPLVVRCETHTSVLPFSRSALVLRAGRKASREVYFNAENA